MHAASDASAGPGAAGRGAAPECVVLVSSNQTWRNDPPVPCDKQNEADGQQSLLKRGGGATAAPALVDGLRLLLQH
eukprot:814191-Prymnesium_polylepis.1